MTTRRGMTTRGHSRLNSSAVANTDEHGLLNERGEPLSDVESLTRSLEVSERENNRLQDQILSLQALLAQRPSAEELKKARDTVKNVELLLAGANKENERAMMETDRANRRIKILEDELARLAGENWQTTLDLAPGRASMDSPQKEVPTPITTTAPPTVTAAYLEEMRLLVIGMESRLQVREEELEKAISLAQEKEKQLNALRKAETTQ